MASIFFDKVYKVVSRVPKGKVATYGQIAKLAGSPKAARAVGLAMTKSQASLMKLNPNAPIVPCHRVVSSNGSLTGYSGVGGIKGKKDMLIKEGVKFKGDRVDLEASGWYNSPK